MDDVSQEFCVRLSAPNAPIFLLLGQGYLRLRGDRDVLWDAIASKCADESAHPGYRVLFDSSLKEESEAGRAWLSERANKLVAPSWLDTVAQYAWSGVYTSSFDGLLNRAFRTDWRSVQPLYSSHLQPLDPRNRARLHISYLFGSIEREEPDQRSPLDEFQLLQRIPQATALFNRLPEQLTPLGTLAIEGYAGIDDWLAPDKLLPVIMSLGKRQAYLFSADPSITSDPLIRRVIADGKLIPIAESLAAVIAQGASAGLVQIGRSDEQKQLGRFISRESESVQVPDHIWTQTSRFATILDDPLLVPVTNLSPEKRYAAFRTFLAESGAQPIWGAYAHGLPFERKFERRLRASVQELLRAGTFEAEPIILHGQAGAGKTVALGALAYRLRSECKYPVVYIGRRNQRFNHADLDMFCQWAEASKFPATLIIWDGMQDIEQYFFLHKYLLGRGREFLLVGSCYRLEEDEHPNANLIEAPARLDVDELPQFKNYLAAFEPSLSDRLDAYLQQGDTSFLVALYRLLPETRSQVRHGLYLEASAAETALRHRSKQVQPEVEQRSVLALALAKAGYFVGREILPSDASLMAGESVSAEQELVGLVMVPGRFGLPIPVEILLRAISGIRITNFHELFAGIDLFRWSEDSLDNIFVSARHPLEAKLIAQSRLGGPRSEADYAKKLLKNIRAGDVAIESTEIQFAAEFVRNLGPNGPEQKLYSLQYLEFANVLRDCREENGVLSPRLMLQEASLLRENVALNIVPPEDLEARLDLLSRAEEVLNLAIDKVGDGQRVVRLKSMLLVELASTLGTKAREYLRGNAKTQEVLAVFNQARAVAMKARALQPEDFFPIDVIAWSTKDLLSHAELDQGTRYEVIVNLFNTFTLCEGDEISVRDKAKLERRRLEFAMLLGDENLQEESLSQLTAIGSTAGHYLMAVHKARELPTPTEVPSEQQLMRYGDAIAYLQGHLEEIKGDGKCMYLLLRYWWTHATRLPFYPQERTPIPLDPDGWRRLLDMLEWLIALDDDYMNPTLMYLEAISRWHLELYDDAALVWRDLQRISDRVTGRRRVLKTFLASNSAGHPRVFHGTVQSLSDDGTKGIVFVEGLRQRVAFFARDFGLEEVRRDEDIGAFHIAFNYIAPTADPLHHYKVSKD